MRPQFLYAKQKGLKLLCANPDIVVDRGETREWCAGALAQLYTEMGGESLYFGKPHPPIYDLARRRLSALGRDVENHRILAIGDGVQTDIKGAMGEDIDSLFITGGLAAKETKTSHQPEENALTGYLEREMSSPPMRSDSCADRNRLLLLHPRSNKIPIAGMKVPECYTPNPAEGGDVG